MFALLNSVCRSHPSITCSSQSNGNLGYLKYYVDGDYSSQYTSYYQSGNKYDWNYVAGSFCPKQAGQTTIRAQAYPALQAMFIDSSISNTGTKCTGTKTYDWSAYLYAHRCYPLSIGDYTNCLSGVYLYGYINGTLIDNTSTTIMDCYTTDCLPGYYTDTCEKEVDAYCNGHGTPEYGRTSDGMGCVCTSYTDNIFCEDTSQYHFASGKRGVQLRSYYDSSKIDYTATYDDFSYQEIGESYATVEIRSQLYVPQNTMLQFQLGSVPNAQLYVDGVLLAGSLGEQFACEEGSFTTVETANVTYTRGIHNVVIKMNSGCAIYNQAYELKWKFYRWYSNNPTGYEDIPARYLGLPTS